MKIKILYDNEAAPGLAKGWGFSCLIILEDEKILFDTGFDGAALISNMRKLGESPQEIRRIVLSHSHWDHIGGINHLRQPNAEIWVPKSFSEHLKAELALRFDLYEVEGPEKIRDGVWTTGEPGRMTKEQSLVIETSKGLLVIVGCSHPGVGNILRVASRFGKVWGILGGLHGFDDYAILEGLGLIVPMHCTVNKKIITEKFQDATIEGWAGLEIDLT